MAVIATQDGKRGIDVPSAWANDKDGNGVYWLMTPDVRGSVMVEYGNGDDIDFTSEAPFGTRDELVDSLHALIDTSDTRDGIIFASVGNTRGSGSPYSVSILRSVVDDDETAQQMKIYYASMLMAYDGGTASITAVAMGMSPEVARREDEIMATIKPGGAIKTPEGKTIRWQRDPYMPAYDHGEPMYAYENAYYDKRYPKHPVAKIRQLIGHVVVNN